jgi:hypothetical protein
MKTAEETIQAIKKLLQETDAGEGVETLDAAVDEINRLDEAINDVLDIITEYEKPRSFEYKFLMYGVEMMKGNLEAKDAAAAEAKVKEILGRKVDYTRYVITEIK